MADIVLDGNFGSFSLYESTDAFANALRAVMCRDVSTPAVSSVVIRTNTSIFPDDFIAHRIGLVPLTGMPSGMMMLRAKGPGRVFSGQMKGASHSVVDSEIVLTNLSANAEIDMELHITTDRASSHARHNAAVAVRFTHRTVGFNEPECFCTESTDTKWGKRCEACGFQKRPEQLRCAPKRHLFQFETTGSLNASELLSQTLAAFHAIVTKISNGVKDSREAMEEDHGHVAPQMLNGVLC